MKHFQICFKRQTITSNPFRIASCYKCMFLSEYFWKNLYCEIVWDV